MYRVQCDVEDGLVPRERVVRIKTSEGRTEEVAVDSSLVVGTTLVTTLIERREDQALIELPNESASGRWRLWVPWKLVESFS